ncbi:ABC transporter substrate-binding protein [candidate division KSB1 bacterium]|nr:ABC transporter substrate-binding protein [candidate division KSB1 bacterium]
MKPLLKWIVIALFLTAPVTGQPPLKKISFLPHWLPQAQFAGIYMAEDLNIFRQHGLEVTIQRGGPNEPPLPALMKGKVDLTSVFLFQGLEAAGRGKPLVNIAQIGQRAALMLVAKKTTGIEEPRDMAGMYLGVWQGFELLPLAFFKKYTIRMHLISAASPINLFLREGIAVTTAMRYNEYHTILASGLNADELVTFNFSDLGLDFPEDGLYCLADTYESRPDVCEAFTAAVLQGWRAAFAQPDRAIESVRRRMLAAHVPYSPAHQYWMLKRMQDIILPQEGNHTMGALKESDFLSVGNMLIETGAITTVPPFSAFYKGKKHAEK